MTSDPRVDAVAKVLFENHQWSDLANATADAKWFLGALDAARRFEEEQPTMPEQVRVVSTSDISAIEARAREAERAAALDEIGRLRAVVDAAKRCAADGETDGPDVTISVVLVEELRAALASLDARHDT